VAEVGPSARGAAGGAGQIYAGLVTTRLTEEEGRGRSLQARGLAVVTTSGTLVTLIFAVAQFVLRGRVVAMVPSASRWLLGIAAVTFVGAAIGGLLANIPHDMGRPSSSDIAEKLNSEWGKQAAAAEKTVALDRVRHLQKLEGVNDAAAWAVLAGLAAEVLAIALAAAAVVVAISASPVKP
jgi:hypothetical protein